MAKRYTHVTLDEETVVCLEAIKREERLTWSAQIEIALREWHEKHRDSLRKQGVYLPHDGVPVEEPEIILEEKEENTEEIHEE